MYFDFRQFLPLQVLNDAPLLPEDSDQKQMPLLMESPQCVLFGTFMIWFASITINLGPTFLSGALAANVDDVSWLSNTRFWHKKVVFLDIFEWKWSKFGKIWQN